MDFFNSTCQESPINEKLFGICDDENGKKAYTNTSDTSKWIATVKNDKKKELVFTAVDKCIIKDSEQEGRGRCDGMLTSSEHLYFVELKNEAREWISDAIDQLESTIKFFLENHDVATYRHKKAFACNKRHRPFKVVDNERNNRFFRTYGFRIDVQAEIIVI
jgi:hypothetical protein